MTHLFSPFVSSPVYLYLLIESPHLIQIAPSKNSLLSCLHDYNAIAGFKFPVCTTVRACDVPLNLRRWWFPRAATSGEAQVEAAVLLMRSVYYRIQVRSRVCVTVVIEDHLGRQSGSALERITANT